MKTYYNLNKLILFIILLTVYSVKSGYSEITNGGTSQSNANNPNYIFVFQGAYGNNNGTSWYDAFTDLQSALDIAKSGDTILIGSGDYIPTKDENGLAVPDTNRNRTFVIPAGVKLFGGFDAGGHMYDPNWDFWSDRDPFDDNFSTVLSGEIQYNGIKTDNAYNVVVLNDSTELNGVHIQKGYADGSVSNKTNMGGGVRIYYKNHIKIKKCIFEENYGDQSGGLSAYFSGSDIVIEKCGFVDDSTSMGGGAIGAWDTPLKIYNSLFWRNSSNRFGSAIFNWGSGSTSTIVNCDFFNNHAYHSTDKGVIHSRGVHSTVKNSIFWYNIGDDIDGSNGGGSHVYYSDVQQSGFAGSNGNISADPMLKNIQNMEFELTANSPCIDAADGNAAPVTDIFDKTRTDIPDITNTGTGTPNYADMGIAEYSQDVKVEDWAGITSLCMISSNMTVAVKVVNLSDDTLSNVPVSYIYDNNLPVTENIGTIPANDTVIYTFSSTINGAVVGKHKLSMFTSYSGDNNSDNDTVTIEWKYVDPISTFPFVEDFEDQTLDGFTYNTNGMGDIYVSVDSAIGFADSYGLEIHGSETYTAPWNYPQNVEQAFQNVAYTTELLNCTVDATSQPNLALSLRLKQHRSWDPNNCWFRVMINDTVYAKTIEGDSAWNVAGNDNEYGYKKLLFDFSAYSGSTFKLSLEALTYVYQPGYDEDFVRLDDIQIWNRTATDVSLFDIETIGGECGNIQDSLTGYIINLGTSAVSNIPVTGTIVSPTTTFTINKTFNGTLQPFQDTSFFIGTFNSTDYGAYVIKLATSKSGDSYAFNDSVTGIYYQKSFEVPFIESFDNGDDSEDGWDIHNAYLTVPSGTANQTKAVRFDVWYDPNNPGKEFYLESDRPFTNLTDKSVGVFDYYYTGSLGQDTLYVEVSEDCKQTWNVVLAESILPQTSQYSRLSTSFSAYANKNVFVRFRFGGSHSSNSYTFFIDNVGALNGIDIDLGNDTAGCQGSGVTLYDGYPAGNYNHQWFKLGSPNVISTDTFYNVTQTGYYIAKVSDSYGTTDSDTIFVMIHPKPDAHFITDTIAICGQAQVNMGMVFNGVPPFIYGLYNSNSQTTVTDTVSSIYKNIVENVTATTLYKIVSLQDSNGCQFTGDFDSLLVISNPLPTVSISGLASNYCADDQPASLTGVPSGGSFSGPGITGNSFNPSLAGTGSKDVVYTYVDQNNCSNSDTAITYVNPVPNVQITSNLNSSYCHDADSVVLVATPMGGSFSGQGVTGNVFRPWQAQAGAVTITYSFSDEMGCGGSDSMTTTVYALPVVTLSSFNSVCANGTPVTLTGGSPAGGSYSGTAVSQGVFYPAIAPLGSDTIKYGYTDIHGCYNDAEATITVNPVPSASLTAPATVCKGDTATISFTGTTTATTNWNFDGGTVQSGTANGPYDISWGTAGPKLVKVVATESGCVSDTAVKLVNVLSSYAHITAVGNTTVCHGDSVTLFANIGPGFQYQWYDANGALQGDTLSYFVAGQSGVYYCEVTNGNGCPAISNSISVTVQPLITADFVLPSTACQGGIVNVQYTGNSGAGATYNWDFDGGTIAAGSGQGPYSIIWNTDSIKNVSLTVNDNGCSSVPVTKSISIISIEAQITALGSPSFCDGDSIVLYANAGPYSYNWKRDGNSINVGTPLYTATTAGAYSVVITDTITNCSDESDSLTVTVNTTDFNLAFTANPTSFSIPPFNTTITNQTPNTANYYWQWDLGDGNTSTVVSPTHQYQFDGTYTVSLFAQNINTGCRDTLVKTNYITCTGGSANPCNLVAAITPSGSATICPDDSIMLTAASNPGANYQWLKDGVLISGATDSVYYASMPGMYQIMVSNSVCSQFSQAFALANYTVITPTIQANGSIMPCTNDSMQLSVTSYFNNYMWSNGATTQSVYVKTSGNYQVTVTDANGCNTTSQPYIVNASLLQTPEICIVGVDSATNHNIIVYERQANPLIDSFKIYRESVVAGVYDLIAELPFSSPGIVIDTASNPLQRAYRYKITAVDTCGQETPPSSYHQTIHLNINKGINNTWNLIWEGYKGFNFGSYRIYRGTDSTNMQLLTQIQSTLNSYTDLNPPAGKVYYQIEVMSPHPCYPDSIYTKAKTNYNTSRSNRVNTTMAPNIGMGEQRQNDLSMNLYPNPNKGLFTLDVKYPGRVSGNLKIMNGIGEVVYSRRISFTGRFEQSIDLRYLSKGVYYVRVQTDKELITGKIVIQ